ncbi:glutaredoxin 3 [bacterium]|nr:glutaredoxin 3 [bacterium]
MNIEIYTKDWCPYCRNAKALLKAENVDYSEIDITQDLEREQEMVSRSGRRTVPQIFLDGRNIGGFDDLSALRRQGPLTQVLPLRAGTTVEEPRSAG